MEKLRQQLKYRKPSAFVNSNVTFGIPMDEEKTRALMELLPGVYNTTLLTSSFKRYFEVALGFWLSGGGRPDQKFDYFKYSSYMGGSLDPSVPLPLQAKDSIIALSQGKTNCRGVILPG